MTATLHTHTNTCMYIVHTTTAITMHATITTQCCCNVHTIMCLCTSVNGLVSNEKHHQCQLQVLTTMSASEVFMLVAEGQTILGTSTSRMNQPIAACTRKP